MGSQVIQASSKIISNFHILQRNTILQVNIFPNYHGKRWGSSPVAQVWCRRRHGSRLFGPGGAESGGRAVGGVHGSISVQGVQPFFGLVGALEHGCHGFYVPFHIWIYMGKPFLLTNSYFSRWLLHHQPVGDSTMELKGNEPYCT